MLTNQQREFLDTVTKTAPATKRHRDCYGMPIWMRDRFDCQENADLIRWGEALCRRFAMEDGHPFQARAKAALP